MVNPLKAIKVLRGALSRPSFPIAENDLWKGARERRDPHGEIVQVDAEKLREGWQKANRDQQLDWNPRRLENIEAVLKGDKPSSTRPGAIDRYPEVGFGNDDLTGPVFIGDGRHRITSAANRNMSIPVFAPNSREAAELRLRFGLGMEDNYDEGGQVAPTLAGINPAKMIKVLSAVSKKLAGVADTHGAENAERLVRAQDEGAHLENYSQGALNAAVKPGNLITNISPGDYQNYARQLPAEARSDMPYSYAMSRPMPDMGLDDVLKYYAHVAAKGKWNEVPWLKIGRDNEHGLLNDASELYTQRQYPIVGGQEGRHRMMTMDEVLNQPTSMMVVKPTVPRIPDGSSSYDRAKILQAQLNASDGRVIPENLYQRNLTEDTLPVLPKTWKEGGHVTPTMAGINPTKILGALSKAIRTFTGSPNKFDKFDPKHIGSGEGSAAFGHGFYSAENPDVADEYRRITGSKSENPGGWTKYGAPVDELSIGSLLNALAKQHFDPMQQLTADAASKSLLRGTMTGEPIDRTIARVSNIYNQHPDRIRKIIEGLPPGYARQKPGWLYTLDINTRPEHFLDLDQPIGEANWKRFGDDVRDAIDYRAEDYGHNPITGSTDVWTGRDILKQLEQPDIYEQLPPVLPGSNAYKDDVSFKQHAAAYLESLGFPGTRYLDKFSRQGKGDTRNYVVFPESSDLIDIVKREKAGGGKVDGPFSPMPRRGFAYDDGGKVEGGGALTLAGINPLKFINFAKKIILPEVQQKAVDKVVDHAKKTGNEAMIVGRYGDDIAKPYTGKMVPGEKGSVRITDTARNQLFKSGPGQNYSVHPHPGETGTEGHVPWSAMPSLADVMNSYAPRNSFNLLNPKLPESLIATPEGALLKIGGLHNAFDDSMLYHQQRDIRNHVVDMFRRENRVGRTVDEYNAHYQAMKDWADAHGVNFDIVFPRLDEKGNLVNTYHPAGQDLTTAPVLNRLGMMGIPVDLQGNFTSDPRVSLEDAMKSWAEYMQSGKAGSALGPMQMKFDFNKGGAVRNYRIGGFGQPDFRHEDDDSDVGALTLAGWRTKAAEKMIAAEKALNKAREPKSPMIVMPPAPKLQTIKGGLRTEFPGIYKDPDDIIADLAKPFIPESENMKRLWGISRGELDEIAQGRDYSHLEGVPHAYDPPPKGKGSAISEQVLTPRNMQRYLDIYGEVAKHPEFLQTRSWYELGPLWDRMKELGVSLDDMMMFNRRLGLHSAGASPVSEIQRGTLAHKLINEDRLDDYLLYGGRGEKGVTLRTGEYRPSRFEMPDFPPDMLGMKSHAFHPTHAQMLEQLEKYRQLDTDTHKIPTYIQATDPVLMDPRRPIADSHIARGAGYSDVRTSGPASRYTELTNPEFADFVPWWERASGKAGEHPRDFQALMWNVLGPQTGVEYIGPSKLEMLSDQIAAASRRLGISMEEARDLILTGKEAAYAEGGNVEGNFTGYGDYVAARAARRRDKAEESKQGDIDRWLERIQPDYWSDMAKRSLKDIIHTTASMAPSMMFPTRLHLSDDYTQALKAGLDYTMPTKYTSDEEVPFIASSIVDPMNAIGAKWLPKGIEMGKGALRRIGVPGFAQGGSPTLGAGILEGTSAPTGLGAGILEAENAKPEVVPGAMDEQGNMPDIGRRTPAPLQFSPVQWQQQGGSKGGGTGGMFSMLGSLASLIPGVGTAAGIGLKMAGSMIDSAASRAEGGRIPAYAGGGSVDDDMLAYHVMNYADGGDVKFRPNSELWGPGSDTNPWAALAPGQEEKSLQQGSTGLGGLLGGGGEDGGMPMGGLLPMIINAISGGKGGKDTGGFMDVAKFISPVAALGRGVGLFEEGGRVPGGALRRCSGGRS